MEKKIRKRGWIWRNIKKSKSTRINGIVFPRNNTVRYVSMCILEIRNLDGVGVSNRNASIERCIHVSDIPEIDDESKRTAVSRLKATFLWLIWSHLVSNSVSALRLSLIARGNTTAFLCTLCYRFASMLVDMLKCFPVEHVLREEWWLSSVWASRESRILVFNAFTVDWKNVLSSMRVLM